MHTFSHQQKRDGKSHHLIPKINGRLTSGTQIWKTEHVCVRSETRGPWLNIASPRPAATWRAQVHCEDQAAQHPGRG